MHAPDRPSPHAPALFEPLEARLALYSNPFLADLPTLADMQNTANTVVRIQTSEGFVDIELYDRAGPGGASPADATAANFLRYVNNGLYENVFFHRHARVSPTQDFVLQGGGFEFTGGDFPPRQTAVPSFGNVDNEFDAGRSNLIRTLAMAKLGDQPDSANSQFFFNLQDNAHAIDPNTNEDRGLDVQNGGFTVFARVIKGWDIIERIASFDVRNLNNFLAGTFQGPFGEVPVSGTGDSDVVVMKDVEVIKPGGSQQFFGESVYFPDGFRDWKSTNTIELVNPDPNAATPFQIIVHFEGGDRDKVIFVNTLGPGASIEVPVSRGGAPGLNSVRGSEPFAYEVRSAHGIAATLRHKDFGAVGSEAFIQAGPFSAAQLEDWKFAGGFKGPANPSYLVWQNLSDQPANVNVMIFPDSGAPFFIGKTLEGSRRGGLNMTQLASLPDGAFSVWITSTQPIVAALSQYQGTVGSPTSLPPPGQASLETGVAAGGSVTGVLPGAYIATGGQAIISAVYTLQSPAVVTIDFDFVLSDGTVLHNAGTFTLSSAVQRRDLDLASANAALPRDQFFTVRYRVRGDAAPVSLSYRSTTSQDRMATAFQTFGTQRAIFADGFTDPTQAADRESISIVNPFASGTNLAYRLRFHFADGDLVANTGAGNLEGGRRVDINIRDLADIMAKIQSGTQFRHYSVTVEGDYTQGTPSVTGAIFAQITRLAAGDTVTSGPTLESGGTLLALSDSRFQ